MSLAPPRPPTMRALSCARCGAAFECGSEVGGCWCAAEDFRLPLPPAGSAEDCLCPTCLRKAADLSTVIIRERG